MKIKIGIFFGGQSREREVSFAGGRTVYDNLNKSIFEPIPIFIDSFGNFVKLDWQFIYKGSIRDFFPPVEYLSESINEFQIYQESLFPKDKNKHLEMLSKIGIVLSANELKEKIDFAFLCLHGPFGEDGKIQGLFEYLNIPYSGSGIFSSCVGIDKTLQKKLMTSAAFNSPEFIVIESKADFNKSHRSILELAKQKIGFPMVIKSATQGSSIGVSIINKEEEFVAAIEKSFFVRKIEKEQWQKFDNQKKIEWVRLCTDIREGIGLPLVFKTEECELEIYHPEVLVLELENHFKKNNSNIELTALDGEQKVLIEAFVNGKEFSCIVIEDINDENKPIALPPTEIIKSTQLFDYRSKYLPGLSRKVTPINIEIEKIESIRKECEKLFSFFAFDVYARIDGFIDDDGKIFLNDPNTTSGMMPSSFFFHQAAEIGLNPSQFLTYIVSKSLEKRFLQSKNPISYKNTIQKLESLIKLEKEENTNKKKVAVILGGYSSERHISVESGRNIYEKLSSSTKYYPIPIFLTGNEKEFSMFEIPLNLMLKDNADDIKEKLTAMGKHVITKKIMEECANVSEKFIGKKLTEFPKQISFKELENKFDSVFIALHGRPGEDGALQHELEKVGLPYNGSKEESAGITINKFETNEILMKNGFLCAKHAKVLEKDWQVNSDEVISKLEQELSYPFIAKPVDDGCSSAVRKIKNRTDLIAFAKLIFRNQEALLINEAGLLKVKLNEEFPIKREFLVEELISKNGAKHFIEITIGLLTKFNSKNEIEYEIFEASEALSEGEILSLEEKFLAGQGQNITPARYDSDAELRQKYSNQVKLEIEKAAKVLTIQGYARIDAFVRIFENKKVEVVFIEVNSLPGMTPATCIFHQTAIQGYTPYDFIDNILEFGIQRKNLLH
jgi:D-alanine-D-alanine ligase